MSKPNYEYEGAIFWQGNYYPNLEEFINAWEKKNKKKFDGSKVKNAYSATEEKIALKPFQIEDMLEDINSQYDGDDYYISTEGKNFIVEFCKVWEEKYAETLLVPNAEIDFTKYEIH